MTSRETDRRGSIEGPRRDDLQGGAGDASMAADQRQVRRITDLLKALAHPTRLRIVARLRDGAQHVSGLALCLDVPQPMVSQQLRILRSMDLVWSHRADGYAYYRLSEDSLLEVTEFITRLRRTGRKQSL